MPPKRNPENRGLPARWVFKDGAFYYIPPKDLRHLWDGKSWFRLGKTLADAYKVWGERVAAPKDISTIGQLFDQYLIEGLEGKAPKTATEYRRYVRILRPSFGAMTISDLEPQHVYQYVKKRSAKVAGHREMEFLSAAVSKAVEWGIIKANPLIGQVALPGEKARTRYVEDWELIELLSLAPRKRKGSLGMVQAYLRLKLLTGLRQRDLLLLTVSDLREDGIHVTPSKTKGSSGKRLVYEWTPALRAAVEALKAIRPAISPYLVCSRNGKGYVKDDGTAPGFNHLWQNCMARVLKDTKVKERFTEHDLRAKVGSDAESLKRATELLGSVDEALVNRVYRRKPERIKPAN
jgi:integrase